MAKKKKGILGTLAGALFGSDGKKSSSSRSRRSSSSKAKTSRGKSKGKSSSSKGTSSSKKTPSKSVKKTPSKPSTGNSGKIIRLIPVRIKKHNDKKGGHPHVILEDFEGDKHVSVGLTSDPKKGKNSTNYKCEVNPLGGEKQSYMHRQGTVAPMVEYEKREVQGALSSKDYERAKIYGDRAKQKYLNSKKQKSNDVPNT